MNLPENDYQILKLTDANETMLHQKEFKRRYEYSSLRYFHKEMGLYIKILNLLLRFFVL